MLEAYHGRSPSPAPPAPLQAVRDPPRNEQAASSRAASAYLDQAPSFPPARGGDGDDDPEYTGGRAL